MNSEQSNSLCLSQVDVRRLQFKRGLSEHQETQRARWQSTVGKEAILTSIKTMSDTSAARGPITEEKVGYRPATDSVFITFNGPESSACTPQSPPSFPFVELRHTLPSEVRIISPLVDQITGFISRFRDGDNFGIGLALREAIANAIVHGNQEDPSKRICVRCRCTKDGEVSITVEDEGEGFNRETAPDPTAPDHLLRGSGRGIYLMTTLMDEVHFEERGTIVHMRKRGNVQLGTEREMK